MANELTKQDEFKLTVNRMLPEWGKALAKHIPLDRFERNVLTAVNKDPKLMEADRRSLFSALTMCAQASLLPNGVESALVMFGDKVTFMPMVAGILKLIRNSGELESITANIIYKNDVFEYFVNNQGEQLNHKPMMFGDRGEPIGVYALAKTKDGGVYIEVMDKQQVMAIRNMARSKNVWDSAFGEQMWKKSAIRRLAKRLPMSTDIDAALYDEEPDYKPEPLPPRIEPGRVVVADEPPTVQPKKSRLSKALDAETVPPPPPTQETMPHDEIPI